MRVARRAGEGRVLLHAKHAAVHVCACKGGTTWQRASCLQVQP